MSSSVLPPGPRSSVPLLFRYFRAPLEIGVSLKETWGDTLLVPGKPPLVVTADPELIRVLYTTDAGTFVPLNQQMAPLIGERSLLLLGGPAHKKARKLLMPPFHGERMRTYGRTMMALTRAHTDDLRAGASFSMYALATHISLDVILDAVFGIGTDDGRRAMTRTIDDVVNGISPLIAAFPLFRRDLFGLGPWARFLRRRAALHQAFDDRIARARSSPGEDVLSLLVQARDEAGEAMPDDEIREHLLTLILAGHETTAISIAWAFLALHRSENQSALERLREEIGAVPDDAGPEAITALPYLDAVCHETLRRYPLALAPSPRRALTDFALGPYTVPAGMGVVAAVGMAHFREETYPEPLRFLPERFLDANGRVTRPGPFEFLPFGGGDRRCLGAAMALYEMKLVVFTLLRRFELRLDDDRPDVGKARAANVGPKSGVPMTVVAAAS